MNAIVKKRSKVQATAQWRILGRLLALIGCLWWALVAQPVAAHGEDSVLQVADAPVGPYTLDIWTAPGILRAGEIHVEVAVMRAGRLVPDSDVRVQMTPLKASGSSLSAPADTIVAANEVRQEAAFVLDKTGTYRVDVTMQDRAGRGGTVTFEIEVVRVPLWITAAIYAQLGVALVFGIWLLHRGVILVRAHMRPQQKTHPAW